MSVKDKLKFALFLHKDKIKTLIEITRSIADYAITKSNFSLIGGGLLGIEKFAGFDATHPYALFSPANDWVPLTNHPQLHNIFLSTLSKLEGKSLPFDYETVKIFHTSVGDIVVLYDRYNANSVRIITKSSNQEAILSFLADAKMKELDSPALSVENEHSGADNSNLLLSSLKLQPIKSAKADVFIEDINKYLAAKINRSIMFYGLPGCGKTTLAHTIIDHFGFRTLKLHLNSSFKLPYFLELIKLLKIEALILDDFDQIEMNDQVLEFLETINRNLKLTIGVANVLEDFDPAILRPGRFDDIIKIEGLEEKTLKELLGELTDEYCDKVREWPVAYIQELIKQNRINPEKLAGKYADLADRVEKLKQSYVSKNKE